MRGAQPTSGVEGVPALFPDQAVVILERRLDWTSKTCALGHELVHEERGGGAEHPEAPEGWWAIVAREERAVERIVAERMVPLDKLARFVDRMVDVGDPVTAVEVADAFAVTLVVAQRALQRLGAERS